MELYIEKGTNYAYTIERIQNITFKSLRSVVMDFTKRLPLELNNELYNSIQRGVCKLQNEPELNMYIHALGLMHEAKLQYAFEHLSKEFIDSPTIDIIDYGCGQAIGTICYADYLKKKGYTQKVRRITLIEPSEIALKRAALHVSVFFPHIDIITILKGFDDLVADDMYIDDKIPTLHILSNVLDLSDDYFNLKNFAYLLSDRLEQWIGDNEFVCVEPFFDSDYKDNHPYSFFQMLNITPYHSKVFKKGTFTGGRDWTCHVVLGKMEARGWLGTIMPEISANWNESKQMDMATQAEKEGRYDEALEHYMIAANKFHFSLVSCRKIGEYYFNGISVEQDYYQAVKWFREAARRSRTGQDGDGLARYALGCCYYYGKGVEQDYSEAVKWFRRAIKFGCVEALDHLGQCYEEGKGVKEIYAEAVNWYRKSAIHGYAPAQFHLGRCYANGMGIVKDFAEAFNWYHKAAIQGNGYAQNNLGTCYCDGLGVEQDYYQAVQWYIRAANQGLSKAQNNLGRCYYLGSGVEQDYSEAVKWFHKSAEQNEAGALNNLGLCYDLGRGVVQDYSEAVKWYIKAANQGLPKAQNNLGNCYYLGRGIVQDYSEAVKWYIKAANQGLPKAQNNLGNCYYLGRGVVQDYSEAVKWYQKAAKQNDANAQNKLGECYDKGKGVVKNIEEAKKWYKKSAEQGNIIANQNLQRLENVET